MMGPKYLPSKGGLKELDAAGSASDESIVILKASLLREVIAIA